VDTVLIEEQSGNFVATVQYGLGEAQGAAGGGRMSGGEEGDGEFHEGASTQDCWAQ
jgi:hypothetical protein